MNKIIEHDVCARGDGSIYVISDVIMMIVDVTVELELAACIVEGSFLRWG